MKIGTLFKVQIFLATSMLFFLNTAFAEMEGQIPLSNGNLIHNDMTWKLNEETAFCEKHFSKGKNNSLSIKGDGKNKKHWKSENVKFEPKKNYQLSVNVKNKDMEGALITGTPFCKETIRMPIKTSMNFESYFIVPSNNDNKYNYLTLGQWMAKGKASFENVSLKEVYQSYRKINNIVLGNGECLTDGMYEFNDPCSLKKGNQSRPLVECADIRFNSYRWCFGPQSILTYKFSLNNISQLNGKIEFVINWHKSGELVVEAGKDNINYKKIAEAKQIGTYNLEIPSHFFPAEEIWVRFRSKNCRNSWRDSEAGNFQVNKVRYKSVISDLDKINSCFAGLTCYWHILNDSKNIEISIEDVGTCLPKRKNELSVTLKNNSNELIKVHPRIKVLNIHQAVRYFDANPRELAPGTTNIKIPYDIAAGKNQLELDLGSKPIIKATASLYISYLNSASYGKLLSSSTPKVQLWSASSGWKISQTRPLPEEKTNKLQIRLAKNETEAIQLVLFPKEEISDFKVTCGKLKGPCGYTIEQKDISVLRVKYLFISNPTDWTSEAGFWPDPLPELSLQNANLIPNQNNPLWIRVYASKNIMAGIYKGEIKLTGKDFRHTIPLEVEIYNFELPDRKSCKTSVSIMPHYIWKYHNVDKIEDKRLILDMYWKNFSKHSISPYEPTPLDPIKFKWPSTKDIQEIAKTTSLSKNILIDILFDWKEWDNAMRKAFELYHFNSFRIKIPGMGKLDWKYKKEPELLGFKDNTLEYKILFNSWCKAYRDHLKEKGWLKYGYAHCFDEPRPEYYDFVMRGFKKLKRIIPDVKRLLTEQPEPELIGGPNIWVPVTSHYNEKNVETCKSAGDEFWWYICCSPVAPYCSIHIDHPATELRVWLWQTWKRGIKGIHHWNATFWTSQKKYTNSLQDPYTDGMTWSGNGAPYGYGDGRLIYPPEKFLFNKRGEPIYSQPVDSIRWEMLRDGIEDYEYLEILKELYKKYSCGLPVETRKKIADAIKIPDELTKSLTEFTKTPSIIEKKRHKIAKSIEEIFETISCSYEK